MAAPNIFRHCTFYYKGRRVATAKSGTYSINKNREQQIGDTGWQGASVGPTTSTLSIDTLMPVTGVGVTLLSDMLDDKYADVAVAVVDGKIHQLTMSIENAEYSWDTSNGTASGKFEFSGGKPKITG